MAVATYNALALTASAVQIVPAPTPNANGYSALQTVVIQNLGPNVIYVGDSTVSTTTGLQVAATTGTLTLQGVQGPLFVRTVTADQSGATNTRALVSI